MAVKDKLATLEDLKTAFDYLKQRVDMWEDITSSLTWADSNISANGSYPTYIGGDSNHTQTTQSQINRKYATVTLAKGDRIRVAGNTIAYDFDGGFITAAVITGNGVNYGFDVPYAKTFSALSIVNQVIVYGTCEFCAPYAGTYTIYDYSGVGNIVVEKQVTT